MASDTTHKHDFRIRDLPTRSVLLFPTRAQVIRDIKDITLYPGPNQIVIDGLAPLVDEHSIKVEGTGSATITDVAVDLLPNREVYEDIYPSDSEEEEDDEFEDSDVETEGIVAANEKIQELHTQLLGEQEAINSAAERLRICDNFGRSVEANRPPPDDLEALIKAYHTERVKIYRDHEVATGALKRVAESIQKAEKERTKLARALFKANEKAEKEKAKEREKRLRKKAEIAKEKQRIKTQREYFWPKKVYRITINLEPSSMTPGASRRSSMDGDTIVNLATSATGELPETPLKSGEISLSLSYITYGASWAPRYDFSLNTVKCHGLLEYGAELKNTTSETWRDAKVILSTSQTSFSGLSESIPSLLPWHVRLEKGARNADGSLFSRSELQAKQKELTDSRASGSLKPRWQLFGRDETEREGWFSPDARREANSKARANHQAPQAYLQHAPHMPQVFGNFGSAAPTGVALQTTSLFNSVQPATSQRHSAEVEQTDDSDSGDEGYARFDDGDPPAAPSLTFEEGAWEETGMTTTYDVPGMKTLVPSNSTIKHKIAKVEFRNVVFSHIVIGKLRQVAFLKARLRNSSKITLLRGPLGLTLDGSFLGQATFPRCSAGETFSLPLGVDPAIAVTYPKPTVRRSQSGIFTKEDSNVFSRTCIITNTKPHATVDLTVLDQVPVSEDERLRIEITNPKSLKIAGEPVRTGHPYPPASGATSGAGGVRASGTATDVRASVYHTQGKDISSKWGTSSAIMKKGGEVTWNVKLNPGQGVKLMLEYEATFPGGESVVGAPGAR
ncbi:hypothetical protein QTJ16_007089 [Diplocarpon rosae]|uniref:Mucoidy inhibitor A n=1 Tax=Diplocarpon rosae TaxID=946125 RepID=A0AAD9W9W0_9HELO|nr:hypothetical protein QTJ16_007089 [Diplocarpon rosae]